MATAKKKMRARSKVEKSGDFIDWIDVGDGVYVAAVPIRLINRYGNSFDSTVHMRIDARRKPIRFDIAGLAGWEAADSGVGFTTMTKAKEHAALWLRHARATKKVW